MFLESVGTQKKALKIFFTDNCNYFSIFANCLNNIFEI